MISGIRIINANQKVLSFLRFLHHGSGGLTSVYQDDHGNKTILKSTLGDDASYEAGLNKRLGRLFMHDKRDNGWDHLLVKYIEGVDIDRFLAPFLSEPAMDDIGCALFKPAYLKNPYSVYATGLDRNIAIAIALVDAQVELCRHGIVHMDIQMANYVINNTEQGLHIEGIDLASAVDLSTKNVKQQERIVKENVILLLEALKAILPRENHQAMLEKLSNIKHPKYSDIISALGLQLSPNREQSKNYTPSFSSPRIPALPEVKVNRRHTQFIQNRLSTAIDKNNLQEAECYLLHGGQLNKSMVKQLMKDSHSAMREALKPYIEEFEAQQLSSRMGNLNLKS